MKSLNNYISEMKSRSHYKCVNEWKVNKKSIKTLYSNFPYVSEEAEKILGENITKRWRYGTSQDTSCIWYFCSTTEMLDNCVKSLMNKSKEISVEDAQNRVNSKQPVLLRHNDSADAFWWAVGYNSEGLHREFAIGENDEWYRQHNVTGMHFNGYLEENNSRSMYQNQWDKYDCYEITQEDFDIIEDCYWSVFNACGKHWPSSHKYWLEKNKKK